MSTAAVEQSGTAMARWQLISAEYTAIFTDGLEPDPARVREIRSFDRDYIPLMARRVFRSPNGSEEAWGYHVIGRHIRFNDPHDPREPIKLAAVPLIWPYPTGTVFAQRTWSWPWAKGSWQYKAGFPDLYLPHDDYLVEWMRAKYHAMYLDAERIQASILRRMREDAAAEERSLEEIQNKRREELKEDHSEFRDAVANELHWLEHPAQRPAPPDPKPFVDTHMERGETP